MSDKYPLSTELLATIQQEFPAFTIRSKRGNTLSLLIDRLLRLVTLGKQNSYLTTFYTVLGSTLYVPESWSELSDIERVILLRHERVHLRQRRRYTFPGMAFLYLLPILPVGLAYGRARLEWEAYTETLRATYELQGIEAVKALRAPLIRRFTSADYAWMWPFPDTINRWYGRVIAEIEAAPRDHPSSIEKLEHP